MDLPAARERNTSGSKFVADRPGIRHGACEAIELRHDQGVTATNGRERLVEAGAFSVGSGGSARCSAVVVGLLAIDRCNQYRSTDVTRCFEAESVHTNKLRVE